MLIFENPTHPIKHISENCNFPNFLSQANSDKYVYDVEFSQIFILGLKFLYKTLLYNSSILMNGLERMIFLLLKINGCRLVFDYENSEFQYPY